MFGILYKYINQINNSVFTEKIIFYLIEFEVKWDIYIRYIELSGTIYCISSVLLTFLYQGFYILSSIWLSIWSNDDSSITREIENDSNRIMHLTVYGLIGFGQSKFKR